MRDLTNVDISSICRMCCAIDIEQKDFIGLFTNPLDNIALSDEILSEIKSFDLGITENDGLPQQICAKCQDAFLSINQFRNECADVQNELRNYFQTAASSDIADTEEKECTEFEFMVIKYEKLPEEMQKESCEEYAVVAEENYEDVVEEESVVDYPETKSHESLVEDDSNQVRTEPVVTELESLKPAVEFSELPEGDAYYCRFCKLEFTTLPSYNQHMEVCPRLYECPLCPKRFSNTSIRHDHIQSHNKLNSFKCDICQRGFRSKIHMTKHKKAAHETGKHVCSLCDQKFTSPTKYSQHIRAHNLEKKYKCSHCERSFVQLYNLSNHERIHTGQRPLLCNICGKNFKLQSNFKSHFRLHSGERPYTCKVCIKDFNHRGSYVKHLRLHNNIRPYQCEVCGKKFLQMQTLKVHMRTHTGERPYKCDLCEKAFTQTHQLKYHKYSAHNYLKQREKSSSNKQESMAKPPIANASDSESTTLYPYTCPICSRGFKMPSSLTSHVKCHSEDRKHICTECGNSFKRAEHLRIHINGVHLKRKPYACDYCNKTFSQSGDRNIHMRSHANEKPFSCRYCSKAFKLQKSLRAHERIHTGEKPFTCEICEMDFISYNALTIHTMKHSEEEKKSLKNKTLLDIQKTLSKDENLLASEIVKEERQGVSNATAASLQNVEI